jgi:hypothetical protein
MICRKCGKNGWACRREFDVNYGITREEEPMENQKQPKSAVQERIDALRQDVNILCKNLTNLRMRLQPVLEKSQKDCEQTEEPSLAFWHPEEDTVVDTIIISEQLLKIVNDIDKLNTYIIDITDSLEV